MLSSWWLGLNARSATLSLSPRAARCGRRTPTRRIRARRGCTGTTYYACEVGHADLIQRLAARRLGRVHLRVGVGSGREMPIASRYLH